jgi:hypothetical protein
VKDCPVVIAFLTELDEIFTRLGHHVAMQFKIQRSQIGDHPHVACAYGIHKKFGIPLIFLSGEKCQSLPFFLMREYLTTSSSKMAASCTVSGFITVDVNPAATIPVE